jgi:hypothetical protein
VLEADLTTLTGWHEHDPETARRILDHGIHSMIVIPVRARGILMGVATFWRSESPEPFEQDDLSISDNWDLAWAALQRLADRIAPDHRS